MHELFIDVVGFPLGSFCVLWDEHVFDELVSLIQIQVR
jgi:hypothetical protein